MKLTTLASICLPVLATAVEAAGSAHHGSLLSFRRRHDAMHKRNASLSTRDERRFTVVRKQKRKTSIGEGDTTEQPDNLAKGSATAKDGCTVWHTASPGEVCLGLIDKTPGWTVKDFYKNNPSVDADCSNLVTGSAYCVTVKADGPAAQPDTKTAKASEDASVVSTGRVAQAQTGGTTPLTDVADDEDCEEDEEEDDEPVAEADEDCDEDEEEDSASSDALDQPAAPAPKPQSQSQNKPSHSEPKKEEQAPQQPEPTPEQAQEEQPQTTSSSSTWSSAAPEQTQEQQPEPQPEQEKEEEKPQDGNNGGGSSGGKSFEGQGTWYEQHGNAGSCGEKNSDDAMIVAIKSDVINAGITCGMTVHITNTQTGVTVDAKVADTCPTCVGDGSGSGIDLSKGLFMALDPKKDFGTGVLPLKYTFSGSGKNPDWY